MMGLAIGVSIGVCATAILVVMANDVLAVRQR